MNKQEQHIFKGLQRDLSVSKFNPDYAFDAQNIRITARDNNTLLTVTNERGNKELILLDSSGLPVSIDGVLIGYNVLNNYITLFTKGIKDNIYRLENKNTHFEVINLFSGNLNFNTNNPIENIGVYENLNIQKVYWIDGLNQTRVINIVAEDSVRNKWNNNSFDFVQTLQLQEKFSIVRNDLANGLFPSGVIQYAFSYYNKYGQESNIFYTSPLHYISFNDRGGSPEDKISNSFTINIDNVDINFDYVRVYSIHRSSIDSTPDVKNVVDLAISYRDIITINNPVSSTSEVLTTDLSNIKIYNGYVYKDLESYQSYPSGNGTITYNIPMDSNSYIIDLTSNKAISSTDPEVSIVVGYNQSGIESVTINANLNTGTYSTTNIPYINYTDNGTAGSSIDPTELLYIGGEDVIAGTLTQKDNTLFLGNIKLNRPIIPDIIKNNVKKGTISFINKPLDVQIQPKGYYPYKNLLYLGSDIKTFKYLDWYRFGIQFQFKDGKWSEPIWVNDAYNNNPSSSNVKSYPELTEDGHINLVQASYNLPLNTITEAVNKGYTRVRGVVVYPSISDREVIAQGVLCPTVYNVGDRFNNSPFAQSSWFCRPNLSFDIDHNINNDLPLVSDNNYEETREAVISNTYTVGGVNVVNRGAWAEFRDGMPIPNNWARNAEIQCLADVPNNPYTTDIGSDLNSYVSQRQEYFFIDQSILNLYSPEIEFDDNIKNVDTSNLKLRIVGSVPVTSNASDINIQTSTPVYNSNKIGFYKEFIGSECNSYHGLKNLISGGFWIDQITDLVDDNDNNKKDTAFFVYAWHRSGSLNNQSNIISGTRSAVIDKKKLSNIKVSSFSNYFNFPWYAYQYNNNNHTGITPVTIFNSTEQSLIKIPSPKNSNLENLNYYGNVDKILYSTRVNKEYSIVDDNRTELFNRNNGYPINFTGYNDSLHNIFTGRAIPIQFLKSGNNNISTVNYGNDPVRLKYKSSPHAVFALNYSVDGKRIVLPTTLEQTADSVILVNDRNVNWSTSLTPNMHFFWNTKAKSLNNSTENISDDTYQDNILDLISTTEKVPYNYLFLAELYNDNINNRFGGQTEEAFENNLWLPAGEPVELIDYLDVNNIPVPVSNATVLYSEGDTFFQRYDCVKTYPYTLEDTNSVVEILSFMCETRVNIDGRYDKNRGQMSNLTVTPENFNKVNKVYSQKNNFFNYRGLNTNKFNINNFPNTITWTKEKQLGSIIDTWTNITLASTLDLDGDKGEVISLNTYNNEIYCFQKQGLSNILFNSRVQIPTSDGVPIEISNGMKVGGKRYVSNTIGCSNKWSIVESPSGIYFIDNETNSLYLYNGQIVSLSDKLGFRQWISEHNTDKNWDPVNYNNYRSFYDKNNNDVYFTYKDHCLCYSELINQFTSFMSYENVPAMFNVGSDFYSFKDTKLWQHFVGSYNIFYNEYKPFSITFVSNSEEPNDKIFNTVEFRADSWDADILKNNKTFDTLEVWNEYQYGSSVLTNNIGYPSSLKNKFRVWKANIPRDNNNNRDRIRNTWAYIKLGMNVPNTYRTEFHDVIVHYFV